ncbi:MULTISPECIES: LacI family DNA-binding transcriptional regulator [Microbacterium]|uniref:LacI family transcriptional regulator n=1 Tax=Microbacterium wangchenii TaxID=2541726 RepID=A0ABX5SUN1_9MICO|nr:MULTISPECIES: LacI family DNA-binding transcriptional regulator [Microbacterium]MCK6067153.1 LacI family transcriptional regulator [Microbacterium sp. EYE_512]QBR89891.1 LacI family transcriptional regulator [Microbacterium wangchenii]TXK16512.1 LacI family transcriptional regulator [Microbacterium wangchenii]
MAKIDEVAKAAGVSISTVSYALSGKRPVAKDTRERIEKAVRELGYSPNAGARMLAGDRTHIFALTEPLRTDTHAPTHMAFVLATAVAARRQGYDILLLTDEEARAGMSRVASSGLVDAILVLDVAPDDPRVPLARAIATPSVFIGVPDDNDGLVCVDLDFETAAAMAVDALADAGHERIALVGQTDIAYRSSNFPPRVRVAAERRAAERSLSLMFRSSGAVMVDPAATRRGVRELVDAGVTGLILHCAQEAHAAALDELAERGLSVPTDISVVAVGSSFDTAALPTAVDTIPLIPQASCDLAVELAMRSLGADRPEPGLHLIPPTYVGHGSLRRPAGPASS